MVNVPCPLLQEIYATKKVRDASGALTDVEAEIFSGYAEALYRTVVARKPKLALEIGMAYGLSTLAIASGLRDAGGGKLISIDPGQTGRFKGIGRLNIERAGYGENHELVEDFDYLALPMLLKRGPEGRLCLHRWLAHL
jgi:predicted O-methyltransferase YrrM